MPEGGPPATRGLVGAGSRFDRALAALGERDGASTAISFRDYAREGGFDSRRSTPEYISIDSYSGLPASLRRASTMVFRLGEAEGTGTQFSLVRVADRLRDFFVFDEIAFGSEPIETFLPETGMRALYPFTLIQPSVEANLINYAVASGALAYALGLDGDVGVPACGRGRYSFEFKPHSSLDAVLSHRLGQVEVDAMFVGRLRARTSLFILEAKVGPPNGSLSLHKLAYPCLAFRDHVPQDMPVIPVYLKVSVDQGMITYNVVVFEPFERGTFALDTMRLARARRLRLTTGPM